jgi:hypothetical protein
MNPYWRTNWPVQAGSYIRELPPSGWITYNIDIKDLANSNRLATHLGQHFKLYNKIVDWILKNYSDCMNTVWWDCDGDQMYFAFNNTEHYTWFVLRWA